MPEWSAEVVLDAALVQRLIAGQFPAIELKRLRRLAEGWDNSVWLVDERWVFRFPRRSLAVAGVRREMALLNRLAPLLPLPIPEPVHLGRPADGYPWPFFGSPAIPGREIADAALSDASRAALAGLLATFLRTLHSDELAHRLDPRHELATDPFGRADMRRRVPAALERLEEVELLGLWRRPASLDGWLHAARDLPDRPNSCVVHGDLHLRHVLVDACGRPTGVIDWGDLCRADPAVDLPLYWSALPPGARGEFVASYGPVDAEALVWARVLAVFLCATLAVYAHREGMRALTREAISGLARACED